jgi:CO/xanthine dehydrogenase Mo-binding subunit
MRECIEAVRDGSGWKEKKGRLTKGKGIGMACGFFVSGAGFPIYRSETYHATVTIHVSEDGGTVHVYTASAEIGQGSDTAFAMIAAETIGIPLDSVKISSGDTEFGIDLGAYSSRQTLMTGHAVKEAAVDVRRQILGVLARELKVDISELDIKDGLIVFKHGRVDYSHVRSRYNKEHRGWQGIAKGREPLTFQEAARIAYLARGTIIGKGKYKPAELGGTHKGAQVVEVSVDMETGKITVEKMTDAHDCGFAINRTSVEGQMQGSLSMGLGEALSEEVKFDEKGRILNSDFGEYKIPTSLDMPNVDPIIVESHEPYGPFGAKEVGEGAIMPTIPAILNAVYDATGIRFQELPLTPERVFTALKAKEQKSE